MVQSEQGFKTWLYADGAFYLEFIKKLSNGSIYQGLWLWWYGFFAHLLVPWPRTLDAVLLGDVPLYYKEKHVKQTFLFGTCHYKLNHGFRKNQAISQIINGHV